MYPKKPGGGNLPQFYDPDDGQYAEITDEEKSKLLDEEIANLVMRCYFGVLETYEPRFPIVGFHNDDYCEIYVKQCIKNYIKIFPHEKITEYLLKKKNKDDKSYFFNIHGYNLNNSNELFEQLMKGANFSQMKFHGLTDYGIKIIVPTTIYSYRTLKNISFNSIWIIKKDMKIYFVTVILKKEK